MIAGDRPGHARPGLDCPRPGIAGLGHHHVLPDGRNPGDGSTLPRTNGARAAAASFGVKLVEQYSGWQPEVMLKHFREAVAASPACIEIMATPATRPLLHWWRTR